MEEINQLMSLEGLGNFSSVGGISLNSNWTMMEKKHQLKYLDFPTLVSPLPENKSW